MPGLVRKCQSTSKPLVPSNALFHYWPSNLTLAVLITAKAQHKLTVTVGTVPQHGPECPLTPTPVVWLPSNQGFSFGPLRTIPEIIPCCPRGSLCTAAGLGLTAVTLLPALGPGVLVNASLLQGKNAVDNFHITGTFNFSFRFELCTWGWFTLDLNKVSRSYQELNRCHYFTVADAWRDWRCTTFVSGILQ